MSPTWTSSPAALTRPPRLSTDVRRRLATALLHASLWLLRAAMHLQWPATPAPCRTVDPAVAAAGLAAGAPRPAATSDEVAATEFHAEAGAPEGALYVDGRLLGWLPGVTRL